MGDFNTRKDETEKTIMKKIREYIEKYYKCKMSSVLLTGKVNYANGEENISYVLFGENLPFRNYYYTVTEE